MFMRIYKEPSGTQITGKIIANFLVGWPLEAWTVMLAFGAMHHDVFEWIPPLGYTQSLILSIFLGILGSATMPSYELWMLRQGIKNASE